MFDFCENMKFSQTVVELGLNCYLQIIKLVSSYYKNLNTFLSDSGQYENYIFFPLFKSILLKCLFYYLLEREDSREESGNIFIVLSNLRLNLDKVLEINQVDVDNDEDDDKETYDKIEYNLIACVSVISHSIKNNNDEKIKNVIMIIIYI